MHAFSACSGCLLSQATNQCICIHMQPAISGSSLQLTVLWGHPSKRGGSCGGTECGGRTQSSTAPAASYSRLRASLCNRHHNSTAPRTQNATQQITQGEKQQNGPPGSLQQPFAADRCHSRQCSKQLGQQLGRLGHSAAQRGRTSSGGCAAHPRALASPPAAVWGRFFGSCTCCACVLGLSSRNGMLAARGVALPSDLGAALHAHSPTHPHPLPHPFCNLYTTVTVSGKRRREQQQRRRRERQQQQRRAASQLWAAAV